MREGMRKVTAGALAVGLVCGGAVAAVPRVGAIQSPDVAWAEEANQITFDYVKKNGVHTAVSDKADMYVMASSETDHTGKLEIHVYGKLKMPYTGQEIDVTDSDESWMKPNPYMKSMFEWAPEDPAASVYDKTMFKNTLPIYVDKGTTSIKMSLKGEEVDLAIPAALSVLDTKPLSEALNGHRAEYEAAKNAGMAIKPETAKAFEDQMAAAEKMLEDAAKPDTTVTQDALVQARQKLNEAFGNLAPEPFKREALSAAIEKANKIIANVPELAKQGKGYETKAYDAFYASYLRAKELMATEDLKFVVGSHEGGALSTQRDFDRTAAELEDLSGKLPVIERKAVDTGKLKATFFKALDRKPADGKGWEASSGRAFRNALTNAQEVLNTAYPSEEAVEGALKTLVEAGDALKEENLDPKSAYTMNIRYRHHAEDAPSHLIDKYFEADGAQVKVAKEGIVPGSEVRIYLDDLDTVKKFDGYTPTTFFYASDDGTLGKVRLFTGEDGRAFVSFVAEANGDLDIKYEKGADSRQPVPAPVPTPELPDDKKPEPGKPSDQVKPEPGKPADRMDPAVDQSKPGESQKPVEGDKKIASDNKTAASAIAMPKTGDSAGLAAVASSVAAALSVLGFAAFRRRRD